MVMAECMLLTDCSVDAKSHVGFGAYLLVDDSSVASPPFRECIVVRRFEKTTSTKLELQTLLWALSELDSSFAHIKVTVFTDSQNTVSLLARRARLEKNNYYSSKNRRLNHYQLYQDFFSMTDRISCEFIKVDGHKKAQDKDDVDHLFTLVDRASRIALRDFNRLPVNNRIV
jgi:ribonuclease HI